MAGRVTSLKGRGLAGVRGPTRVRVLGSWHGWAGAIEAVRSSTGEWTTPALALPAGRHVYKFLIDDAL